MGLFDGGPESIILILVIIVFLFGSEKLPELARSLGRARMEFDRGRRMFMEEMKKAAPYESGDEQPSRPADDQRVRSRVERAAEELGIDTAGKSEEELREAVIDAIKAP